MGRLQVGRRLLVLALSAAKLWRPELDKRRALLLYNQWRKIQALSKLLSSVLEDSRHASSWPGDRLPVGLELSEQIEQLTRRIQFETRAFHRMQIEPATA